MCLVSAASLTHEKRLRWAPTHFETQRLGEGPTEENTRTRRVRRLKVVVDGLCDFRAIGVRHLEGDSYFRIIVNMKRKYKVARLKGE